MLIMLTSKLCKKRMCLLEMTFMGPLIACRLQEKQRREMERQNDQLERLRLDDTAKIT